MEEYKYTARHKPTKKWVLFKNDDLELTVIHLVLTNFEQCTLLNSKRLVEVNLKCGYFNKTPNYGLENFLEFEIVKLKATYTIVK